MQFKKHFSSNLQNLSVKKTLVVNPPPSVQMYSCMESLSDSKRDSSGVMQSPNDSRYSANKENIKYNETLQDKCLNNPKSSGRGLQEDPSRMSPMLTFNKIKKNTLEMMEKNAQTEDQYRKVFQPIDNNVQNSRGNLLRNNKPQFQSSKNLQVPPHSLNSNKSIRLGSMVFGSFVKKENDLRKEKSPIRESRSFDRLSSLKTDRSDTSPIECMNNDGEHAKYKVIKHENEQEELLFYCFNCAIFLVKQGFSIEELTPQDRKKFKMRHSHYMSKSDFHRQELNYPRASARKPLIQNEKIKIGEQVKCKIIMKLNKLKVNRQEFNKTVENHLENIDCFYHSLASYIEQQRLNDRQEIVRMKNIKKNEPENYESQLSSSLGTIDYMMKNLQGVNYDFLREVEALLENEVSYPKMRINVEPMEGFQGKIEEFANFFQRNLKISLGEEFSESNRFNSRRFSHTQESSESAMHRNHPLRFSFEQALQQSSKNMFHNEIQMNPLEQENESQLDESLPIVERRQNAFRNLFPQETDEYQCSDPERVKQSPVFKQF